MSNVDTGQITAETLARELIDRCVKAEVRAEMAEKRAHNLHRAAWAAIRAKTPEKVRNLLVNALDADNAML